jgi:hypothetical protein
MSSKKSSIADLEAELDNYYKTYDSAERNCEERKRLRDLLGN